MKISLFHPALPVIMSGMKDLIKKIPKEKAFIIYLLRNSIYDSFDLPSHRFIKQDIDWTAVLSAAISYKIEPLIYYELNKRYGINSSLPSPVINALTSYYEKTLKKNTLLWQEFCRITDTLREKEIDYLPLKGIILIKTVYSNIGIRKMSDIDILIRSKDVDVVTNDLLRLGYKKIRDDAKNHYTYINDTISNDKIEVDVHTKFRYGVDKNSLPSEIWQKKKSYTIDGKETGVPSPEDLFLCLASNICYRRLLKNLYDMASLLQKYKGDFDWDYVLKEAGKDGYLRTCAFFALFCLKKLLNTDIYDAHINKIKINYLRQITIEYVLTKRLTSESYAVLERRFKLLRYVIFPGEIKLSAVMLHHRIANGRHLKETVDLKLGLSDNKQVRFRGMKILIRNIIFSFIISYKVLRFYLIKKPLRSICGTQLQ
ncbi:MAG: nucleotidyltransferase family protein [Candidatus Omnitrophica bacterium]|nr:nucleotidyltransferase family protein [Candidatus Omnitrophota bacterium]